MPSRQINEFSQKGNRKKIELVVRPDFNKDVEVIMGTNSAEGIIMVYDALLNSSKWRKYADDWENSGTRALFNIADPRFGISFVLLNF